MNETKNNGRIDNESHALRGGGWVNLPVYCRAANRNRVSPDYRSDNLGGRLALPSRLGFRIIIQTEKE